jgi:hypothetical protein
VNKEVRAQRRGSGGLTTTGSTGFGSGAVEGRGGIKETKSEDQFAVAGAGAGGGKARKRTKTNTPDTLRRGTPSTPSSLRLTEKNQPTELAQGPPTLVLELENNSEYDLTICIQSRFSPNFFLDFP